MSKFTNPRAQMQAMREAARQSPRDTGKEIEAFARDRLLCRIFSESNPSFILKGGQGMLARTGAARETRNIDMLGISPNLAEKVCAIYETHNGRPSSRVKDLVDLGIIALSESVDGSAAASQLILEFKLRKIAFPSRFTIPREWEEVDSYRQSYEKLVAQTGCPVQLADMHSCVDMIRSFIDPLLDRSAEGESWIPASQQWHGGWQPPTNSFQ